MEHALETSVSDSELASRTELPFYLFGGGGRRAVPCRVRWISDHYAYVVAPLATATAVKQQWEAAAVVPADSDQSQAHERRIQVELVSAEALLGSDSGREGLLLRFLGSQEGSQAQAAEKRAGKSSEPLPAGS
ncbi:MAG: hypothetical protein ACYSUI_05330 [Planctomycetota bacterium]|jgi:hypothetical protein